MTQIRDMIHAVKKDEELVAMKREELIRLETMCYCRGADLQSERVTGTRDNESGAKRIINYIEAMDDFNTFMEEVIERRNRLIKLIDGLKSVNQVIVMYEYCLFGKSMRMIAKEMNYSEENIRKLYRLASNEIESVLKST